MATRREYKMFIIYDLKDVLVTLGPVIHKWHSILAARTRCGSKSLGGKSMKKKCRTYCAITIDDVL